MRRDYNSIGLKNPEGKRIEATYADNLAEIAKILEVLPQPANAVVATAEFTAAPERERRS